MSEHVQVGMSSQQMLGKLYKDMYEGNGKPSMTVRMEALETGYGAIKWLLATVVALCTTTLAGVLIVIFTAYWKK